MNIKNKIIQPEYKSNENVKKSLKIATVVIFIAMIFGNVFILSTGKDSKSVSEQKQQINKVYKEAGVDLSNSDYIVDEVKKDDGTVEEVVAVKQEKVDKIHEKSNRILNSINQVFTGKQSNSNDYSESWNNQPDSDKTTNVEDLPQNETITPGLIKSAINDQIVRANDYLDRSLDKEENPIYSKPLEVMIDAIRSGDEEKINDWYDFHMDTTTNKDAFGVFCSYAKSYSVGDDTTPLWNNSGLGYAQSNVLSNIFTNKIDEIGDIEVIIEDSSKEFSYLGEDIQSVYKVLTKDRKVVYLTRNLSLLDIEEL